MALNYMVYQYDGSRNAVVMTDMDGWEIVIDCDRAEAQVMLGFLPDLREKNLQAM